MMIILRLLTYLWILLSNHASTLSVRIAMRQLPLRIRIWLCLYCAFGEVF